MSLQLPSSGQLHVLQCKPKPLRTLDKTYAISSYVYFSHVILLEVYTEHKKKVEMELKNVGGQVGKQTCTSKELRYLVEEVLCTNSLLFCLPHYLGTTNEIIIIIFAQRFFKFGF